MAGRPLKQGLDYFSLDVDFFQNVKVKTIIKAYGAKSVSVLICLLVNIYRKDGYFMRWAGDMGCMISEETGLCIGPSRITEPVVTDVLSKALSVDFFDAGIFDNYGVLTSRGIQERYFAAVERRKKVEIIKEFFLLDPSDVSKNAVWKSATTMPIFRKNEGFGINVDNNSINVSNNSINVNRNEQSKVKYINIYNNRINDDNNPINVNRNSNNVDNNSINDDINSINVNNNSINEDRNSINVDNNLINDDINSINVNRNSINANNNSNTGKILPFTSHAEEVDYGKAEKRSYSTRRVTAEADDIDWEKFDNTYVTQRSYDTPGTSGVHSGE